MKSIFTKTLLFCIISIHFGYSQTVLPNIISAHTTLLKANSPYYIQTSTLVSDNIILTIEPGVVINMDGVLNIRGKILANGSSLDSIYFNCNNTNGPGIRLIKGTADTIETYMEFNFCRIKSKNVGIYGLDRRVKIKNSKIEFCLGDGVFLEKGEIVADSSSFSYNQGNGIKVTGNKTLIIPNGLNGAIVSRQLISNCKIKNNNLDGITLSFQQYGGSSPNYIEFSIQNNIIESNRVGVLFNGYGCNFKISKNKIFLNSNYGLTFNSGPALITNEVSKNIIAYNKGAISQRGNAGGIKLNINKNIIFKNSSSWSDFNVSSENIDPNILNVGTVVNFINNSIIENDMFNLMQINNGNDSLVIKNNLFKGNVPERLTNMSFIKVVQYYYINNQLDIKIDSNNFFMDNKSTYLIKNNLQTFDIFLKHNYKNIPKPNFDGFYGFYGFVYEQFPSSTPNTKAPISPVSFYIDSSAAQKVISWKQNPEADLKGYRVYFNKVSDFEYSNSVDVGLTNNYAIPLGTTPGTEFSVTAYDNDYDGVDDIFDGNESFYANPSQNISSLVYKGTNVNNTQESSLAICALESYSIKAIGTCDSIKWNIGYTGKILTLDTLTQSNKFYFECFRNVPVLHSITSDTVFINVKPNLAILNSIHGYSSDQSFSAKKIQSSSKIKNSKIDYWAENSIEFLPGFKVENGEHFEAKIKAICLD
jgi:hypothetical protein